MFKNAKSLGNLSHLEQEEVISLVKKEVQNSDLEFEYEGFLFGLIRHNSHSGKEALYFYTRPDLVNFGKTEKEREEFRKKINIDVLWLVKELLKNDIAYAYGCICCNEFFTSYEEVLEHIILTNYL